MWHFIIEATPKDHPVILAVLDDDCFHALDFPCRYSEDGRWIDVTSGRSVDVRPALARMGVTPRPVTQRPHAALTGSGLYSTDELDGVVLERARGFSAAARFGWATRRSNLQIEIALAGFASKVVLGVIATAGWP
jgi:hypothetical protein